MADFALEPADRDLVRLALRGDVDMRRYVPEIMRLCARLGIDEPPWMEEPELADRVALNRERWPARSVIEPPAPGVHPWKVEVVDGLFGRYEGFGVVIAATVQEAKDLAVAFVRDNTAYGKPLEIVNVEPYVHPKGYVLFVDWGGLPHVWPPEHEDDAADEHRRQDQTLAQIGIGFMRTGLPTAQVRIPAHLARDAVAAGQREKVAESPTHGDADRAAQQFASELARIGEAVTRAGRWEGESVEVELPADLIASAVEAARDHLDPHENPHDIP